jgi:16S rRNA (guanine(966)-N(2))-methyltransferase RsmD
LRIIAGSAKGRRFESPKGQDTRPTLDRVKESLFGMLQFQMTGATVLDLFSGSGNLGLEAASRGAKLVVCNDHDRACAALIRSNAEMLGLQENIRVMCLDYAPALDQLHKDGVMFDIALLDAPYASGLSEQAAKQVLALGLIRPGGLIIIEHARKLLPILSASSARQVDQRFYGDLGITTWERVL